MASQTNNRGLYNLSKPVHSVTEYLDSPSENLITPEMRAYMSKFSDPLHLNFKLMVDYTKPSGIFAPETEINSSLAYLLRIGEIERYNMLKRWQSVFQQFIKGFEFLILEIEGVDEIINRKPSEMYTDDAKVTITIRETSDMLIQSLLTTWRHIWFDDIRCVEVLPSNLRKFDLNILIFNSGYYDMDIYDNIEDQFFNNLSKSGPDNNAYQKKMFPTIKKMSDKYFHDNADKYDFNYHLVMLKGCGINNEESGKEFFTNLTNEMTNDFIKNKLVLNFGYANYKGVFNNIFGEFDFVSLLVKVALENSRQSILSSINAQDYTKEQTLAGNNTEPYMTSDMTRTKKINDYFKNAGDSFKQTGLDTLNQLKKKPGDLAKRYVGPNSVIGNAIKDLTDPNMLVNMAKNTVDKGLSYVEDKVLNSFISKADSMIMNNFHEDFVSVYQQYFQEKDAMIAVEKGKTIETETPTLTIVKDGSLNAFDKPATVETLAKGFKELFNKPKVLPKENTINALDSDINKTYSKLDKDGNPIDSKGNKLDPNLVDTRYVPNAAKVVKKRTTVDDVIVDFATANTQSKSKQKFSNISESHENAYIQPNVTGPNRGAGTGTGIIVEKNIDFSVENIHTGETADKNITQTKTSENEYAGNTKNKNISFDNSNIYTRKGF